MTLKSINELLPPVSGRDYYRDQKNASLVLQVTSSGSKTWYLQIVDRGRTRRIKLANFPSADIETARRLAVTYARKISEGIDPVRERRVDKATNLCNRLTLRELLNEYLLDRGHRLKPSTRDDYEKSLRNFCPDLLDVPANSITPDLIFRLYRDKAVAAPYGADKGRRVLGALFKFHQTKFKDADGSPLVKVSPVILISERKAKIKIHRRKRMLQPEHMPAWYLAVCELEDRHYSALLKFLLFTGCRYTEGATLSWADIDVNGSSFILRHTKNGEVVTLPLPKTIIGILNDLPKVGPFVFSSTDTPLDNAGRRYRPVKERSGVEFSPHDLRRTFVTTAESLDIGWPAIKGLVNHLSGASDVTAGYVSVSLTRLRKASERIEQALLAQIAGSDNWQDC